MKPPVDVSGEPMSPPHSQDSELLILGTMLSSKDSLNIGIDSLEEEDFYFPSHKLIFSSMKRFYERDWALDEHLLIEDLKQLGNLVQVGGIAYIKNLSVFSECYSNVEECIQIVRNLSLLRKMGQIGLDLYARSFKTKDAAVGLLDEVQGKLFKMGQGLGGNAVLLSDVIKGKSSGKSFLQEVEERQKLFIEKGPDALQPKGIKTKFIELDKTLNVLGNTHLIILAARPAMGKTAFALSIAENVALDGKKSVGIFSLEMSADELSLRMICSRARVSKDKTTNGTLNGSEFQKLNVATHELDKCKIIIDDQSRLNIRELRSRARRMKEVYGIDIIIVDYLQLLSGSTSYRGEENRQTEVADISRNMKILAKELNIPIVCLAQLSRKVEDRESKKPVMSDLRESGALEQDADVVLLLSRPDVYDPYNKPGIAELTIAKNRHGPTGMITLAYIKEFARFENLETFKNPAYDCFPSGD